MSNNFSNCDYPKALIIIENFGREIGETDLIDVCSTLGQMDQNSSKINQIHFKRLTCDHFKNEKAQLHTVISYSTLVRGDSSI